MDQLSLKGAAEGISTSLHSTYQQIVEARETLTKQEREYETLRDHLQIMIDDGSLPEVTFPPSSWDSEENPDKYEVLVAHLDSLRTNGQTRMSLRDPETLRMIADGLEGKVINDVVATELGYANASSLTSILRNLNPLMEPRGLTFGGTGHGMMLKSTKTDGSTSN